MACMTRPSRRAGGWFRVRRGVTRPAFRVRVLLPLLLCLPLLGCPGKAVLLVRPTALDFGLASERTSFTIVNGGTGALEWSVHEVVWRASEQRWLEQNVSWLRIDVDETSGTTTTQTDRVHLNANRQGMQPGLYSGVGVRVESNGGSAIIPVALTVSGTPVDPEEPYESDLVVAPTAVSLQGLEDTGVFTITNEGAAAARWTIEITINSSDAAADAPIQIEADPGVGVTLPEDSTTVIVSIPDPDTFDTGTLNYLLAIRDQTSGALIEEVYVTVDLMVPPVIATDTSVLDFGEEDYRLEFLVANVGPEASRLGFALFTLDEGDIDNDDDDVYLPFDFRADTLVAGIGTAEGTENIPPSPDPAYPFMLARPVSVTIARDGIVDDLEVRRLFVGAVAGVDAQGNPVINAGVTPAQVNLRVEAAAYVEGAINRSRPPSIMRFVFLLRDKRGVAVDAADAAVLDQITFDVQEDDFPLDPDESSMFVSAPDNLKCNLVVLLDYTGSMYNAGVDDPVNPLRPGEAIDQMVQAAKQFILGLPPSYSVALMEYHERYQQDRLIRGFDTNKAALAAALDSFSLPEGEHGASEVLDALVDACDVLANEDALQTLPFDEADVRSVVYVSDGWDTSSVAKITEVIDHARENRVRLYPIGFGGRLSNPANDEALIQLAAETGGHPYLASELPELTELLDTTLGLAFNKPTVSLASGVAVLPIRNNGTAPFAWHAEENLDWLTVTPPSGTVPPAHRTPDGVIDETGVREVTISASPGNREGTILITSSAGDATVSVTERFNGGSLTQLAVVPQTDDPGKIWGELRGQVVLTYTSLFQEGSHSYSVTARFPDSEGAMRSAAFEEDAIFWGGDVRAGQIALSTTGIVDGTAEVFVRTDYVPRNIEQFRFRFILDVPEALTPDLSSEERAALLEDLKAAMDAGAVALAPEGLIARWRLIPEGNGVFTIVPDIGDYLVFGAFGDLMKLTFTDVGPNEAFEIGFRVDNSLYYSPATNTTPSLTKYFWYPGGYLNPRARLNVSAGSDLVGPATDVLDFLIAFDPEEPHAWDRDEDTWPDFDDADPDDEDVGDRDGDGIPDLDDPVVD